MKFLEDFEIMPFVCVVERNGHLIIDGFNVIYQLPELLKLLRRSQELACAALVDEVSSIHSASGMRVSVVFDGVGQKVDIQYPTGNQGIAVLYAPSGLSADGLIEQLVAKSSEPETITVASRDNAVALSIRTNGAFTITPEELQDWIRRSCERSNRTLQRVRQHNRKFEQNDSPWAILG